MISIRWSSVRTKPTGGSQKTSPRRNLLFQGFSRPLALVRVFNHRFEQLRVHVRQEPGRFSSSFEDLHPRKISGLERGAAYLLKKARVVCNLTRDNWIWAEECPLGPADSQRCRQGLCRALGILLPSHSSKNLCDAGLLDARARRQPRVRRSWRSVV
jgi:hypothetical protein